MTTKEQHREEIIKCIELLADRASELGEYDMAFLLLSISIIADDGITNEAAELLKNFQDQHDARVAKKIEMDFDVLFGSSDDTTQST